MATSSAVISRPSTATGVAIPSVNHVPGYGGFCPAVETQYGKTFGNATRNYYDLSRQDSLNTSRKERRRSSSDSSIAVVNLTLTAPPQTPAVGSQSSTVWSRPLPYALNLTGPRRDQVLHFNQSAQTYRNYYKDHSGMAVTVPNIARRRYSSAPLHRTRAFSLPLLTSFQLTKSPESTKPVPPLTNYPSKLYQRTSSAKDRAVRDVFFQKR